MISDDERRRKASLLSVEEQQNHPAVKRYIQILKDSMRDPHMTPETRKSISGTPFSFVIADYEKQLDIEKEKAIALMQRKEETAEALSRRKNNPPLGNGVRIREIKLSLIINGIISTIILAFAVAILINVPPVFRVVVVLVFGIAAAIDYSFVRKQREEKAGLEGLHDLVFHTFEWPFKTSTGKRATVSIRIEIPLRVTPPVLERLKISFHTIFQKQFDQARNVPSASDIDVYFQPEILPTVRELDIYIFRYTIFEPVELNEGLDSIDV